MTVGFWQMIIFLEFNDSSSSAVEGETSVQPTVILETWVRSAEYEQIVTSDERLLTAWLAI